MILQVRTQLFLNLHYDIFLGFGHTYLETEVNSLSEQWTNGVKDGVLDLGIFGILTPYTPENKKMESLKMDPEGVQEIPIGNFPAFSGFFCEILGE